MEVTLLGIVTFVNPLELRNALLPIDVTGRLLIVGGMIRLPVALGELPVIWMEPPVFENVNTACTEVTDPNVPSRHKRRVVKCAYKDLMEWFIFESYWLGSRDCRY